MIVRNSRRPRFVVFKYFSFLLVCRECGEWDHSHLPKRHSQQGGVELVQVVVTREFSIGLKSVCEEL